MSVGWDRAAARLQRESQRRQDRRDDKRSRRKGAEPTVHRSSFESCAQCGALTDDAFISDAGEICGSCFANEEVAIALAPVPLTARLALPLLSTPAVALTALLAFHGGTWSGYKGMTSFALLSLFAAGWGLWTALHAGSAGREDLSRLDERFGVARAALSLATVAMGLLTAGLASVVFSSLFFI